MSIAKNSLFYLFSTISLKAVGFLLLPLFTHLVSPTEYGYVYVVSAFQTFMGLFLSLSMPGAIGRFYFDCKSLDEIRQMYSQQVLSITISATIITILMLLMRRPISDLINLPERYYILAIFISYFSLFYNLILALLYAMAQAAKISITSIIVGAGTIVMQLILVFTLDNKASALILAMLFSSVATFVIFLVYSIPFFAKPVFNKANLIKYFKYSLSQLPSDVSVWFVAASDRLLLNRLQGTGSAGIYGMGNTLGQIPSMLYQSVNKAYVPYVFQHYKDAEQGRSESLKAVSETTTKIESLFTCVVVVLIILSNNIVSLLGERYIDSSFIMPLVLFAVWIDCNRIIFMNPLAYNIKYIKVKSMIWIFAAILDVCLNLYLIPRFSIYGACVSLIISYGMSCLLILYFSNKAMKIKYDTRKITKVVLLSLLFVPSYFLGNDLKSFYIKLPIVIIYIYIIIKYNKFQIPIHKIIHKCYV